MSEKKISTRHPGRKASKRSAAEPGAALSPSALGNRTLARLLASGSVRVSQPGDPQEKEADRIAGAVTTSPGPLEQESAALPSLHPSTLSGVGSGRPLDLEARAMLKPLQPPTPLSPPVVQGAPRSHGEPLAPSLRASLEPRFGRELDGVRVHTGPVAAAEAHALGARAFTQGRDVVFAAGRYAPGSREGLGLLAHELTHVVQQSDAGTSALQRAPDPAAAKSMSKVPSLPEPLEIGAGELISAQNPKLAVFAKMVLASLQSFPAGTVNVTCYWSPGADIADNAPRRTEAAIRAGVARSALVSLDIPASKVTANSMDATLLSSPAPPSGQVLIAFFPQPFELGLPQIGFSMLQPTAQPKPGGKPLSLSMRAPATNPPTPISALPGTDKDSPGREGTASDVVKAVLSVPAIKKAVDGALAGLKENFEALSTVDQIFTVHTAISLGAGTIGAIASNPETSKKALDWLNGKQFPVPWVDGLEIQIFTKEGLGGAVQIDLMKFFWKRKMKKERERNRSFEPY